MGRNAVLLSWVAVNNDPYERETGSDAFRLVDGHPVPGPTMTLLFDPQSQFKEQIGDVLLLHRSTGKAATDRETRAVDQTVSALSDLQPDLRVHFETWDGKDPTDHHGIFEFLTKAIPRIRKRFPGRELVIHISPGTPSMQTIWVLMAETGFIEQPFQLVKSYRKSDRRGRPAVAKVELGIETFYKVYKSMRPRQTSSEDQGVLWDPSKFQTAAMQNLFVEARRFAQLNVPVLILGERGTGKTTLASWMRLHSPFRRQKQDGHWPAVACGQYSPETMRSELFGYKKGAFTGATKDSAGLLAMAHEDTLFLDEVGDVSRDLQRLLIKALEEKQYVPLGDDRPKKSNFRLLTATNVGHDELARRLDPDFLDRISMVSLRLPALREVREEIPWLWETVFEQAVNRTGLGKRQSKLAATHHTRVASALMHHPLPGNLRDLFRVAYRLLAARNDPHEPLSPEQAVAYSLRSLDGPAEGAHERLQASKEVAGAYSKSLPLDPVLEAEGRIETKAVEREMKAFMAEEIRRFSKTRGIATDELCDVSDRALRSWLDAPRRISSKFRKVISD